MIALHREVLPYEGQTVFTKVDGQKVQAHFRIEPLIRGGVMTNTILVLQTF
jgi:hypothetical protein